MKYWEMIEELMANMRTYDDVKIITKLGFEQVSCKSSRPRFPSMSFLMTKHIQFITNEVTPEELELIGHWDGSFWSTKYFCFSQQFLSKAVCEYCSYSRSALTNFWVKSNLRLLHVCDIGGHQSSYFSCEFQSRSIWLSIAVITHVCTRCVRSLIWR